MDLATAIRTTGAARRFRPEPVDDATVAAVLDDARFAPSGGNRQGWRVVVVKDTDQRRRLGALMRPVWEEYAAAAASGLTPFNVIDGDAAMPAAEFQPPPNDLIDHITDVPVVLVVGADLRRIAMMDKDLGRATLTGGASIYPFCWNVVLAARSRGLGGVITTFLSRAEPAAAPALGLPPHVALAATIFLGHPEHQPTRLSRAAVNTFATIDRFDGPAFGG